MVSKLMTWFKRLFMSKETRDMLDAIEQSRRLEQTVQRHGIRI